MMRMVSIRNRTSSDVLFGGYTIPSMGTISMSYPSYSAIVKGDVVQRDGLDVLIRDVEYRSASVKDFGAKGDGMSDDTYQIQSAIDYVASNGGGVVNVPIGVYMVRSLNVSGNVMIVGESKADSVIKSVGEQDALITFMDCECGISDMTVMAV